MKASTFKFMGMRIAAARTEQLANNQKDILKKLRS